MRKIHKNARLPNKGKNLKEEENKRVASERMVIEHVIGMLKRFKIINCKYRNRRKRFSLRFNLAVKPLFGRPGP